MKENSSSSKNLEKLQKQGKKANHDHKKLKENIKELEKEFKKKVEKKYFEK